MWAAGLWRAASPTVDTWALPDCRARSWPSSGSSSVPMADTRGHSRGTAAVCSPSPPLSCRSSTLSLLSPLRHQSFPFDDDSGDGEPEDVDDEARDPEAKGASLRGVELQGCAR